MKVRAEGHSVLTFNLRFELFPLPCALKEKGRLKEAVRFLVTLMCGVAVEESRKRSEKTRLSAVDVGANK